MPAILDMKSNPVAMRRACRFRLVLDTRYQAIATTMPMISICQTRLRNRGSDQLNWNAFFGAERAGCSRGSMVVSDIHSPNQAPADRAFGRSMQALCNPEARNAYLHCMEVI